MTLIKKENRPGYADSADVNGIHIHVYPGNGEARGCLIITPFFERWESPDIDFTEQELRELAEAATWAADKLAGRS